MADQWEKMMAGEYIDSTSPELLGMIARARQLWSELNRTDMGSERYRLILQELIPSIPASSIVLAPFYCDYGKGITLGRNVFVNFNCTMLDGGGISIGDNTLIGPGVQIYTPHHPVDHIERRQTIERGLKVSIGSDCWIGGGVVICPGTTIGDRCIIGAGSVVVKDIPDDSMAAGNPATVKKRTN